ncbi:hypothetical protein ACFLQO_01105 [Candidatus Aenigmatarchaeota archaeon]
MKKAQAAMEYLMTYGWAIIIVIIVAAALYAMGLFSPGAQSVATGFPNVGTPEIGAWQLLDTGAFTVKLKNNAPYAVNITSLTVEWGATACTTPAINSKTGIGAGIWLGMGTEFNITATCGTPSSGSVYGIDIQVSGLNDKAMTFSDKGRVTGTVA